MSAQRAVPPARAASAGASTGSRTTGAIIAALAIGVVLGGTATWLLLPGLGGSSALHRAARAASPDGSRVASAHERMCGDVVCGELRAGPAAAGAAATTFDTYRDSSCDEIVWTPDGKRVGFLMTGQQLVLYDAQTLKHVGNVRLLTQDAAATRRARGVTFSENGRAVTFDDCPRSHSGCRAGVVGIPQ